MKHSLANRDGSPVFGTLRLSCRPVETRDTDFYRELFGTTDGLTPTEAEAKLAKDIAHWRRQGFGRWLLSHADHPIGCGALSVKDGFAGLKLSFHFLPEMWGQGLASEFVRGALDLARDELGSEEVYGLVRPGNIASIRVLEKAGFRDTGLHSMTGGPMRELRLAL